MQNTHCSLIAHRLAEGGIVDERWLWSHHIRNQHKRLDKIAFVMRYYSSIPGLWPSNCPFWPIQNIGSPDGHPVKSGGRTTRCGRYYLPAKFRPALRKAIKKMGW